MHFICDKNFKAYSRKTVSQKHEKVGLKYLYVINFKLPSFFSNFTYSKQSSTCLALINCEKLTSSVRTVTLLTSQTRYHKEHVRFVRKHLRDKSSTKDRLVQEIHKKYTYLITLRILCQLFYFREQRGGQGRTELKVTYVLAAFPFTLPFSKFYASPWRISSTVRVRVSYLKIQTIYKTPAFRTYRINLFHALSP